MRIRPDFWIGNTIMAFPSILRRARTEKPAGKEIVFNPKTSILAYNLIDRDVRLEKPEVYHFYLITTPCAACQKNWRDWRVRTRYGDFKPTMETE